MRIFGNANYPFNAWRKQAFIASGILMALGVGGMITNVARTGSWLEYGVDFLGGTVVHVDFEGIVEADQLRAVNPGWEIKRFGEPEDSEFEIRMGSFEDRLDADPAGQVMDALSASFDAGSYEIIATDAVGPRVGNELQQRAVLAVLISFGLTLVYLAFRFEWRFGVAAVVATAHDIFLTLGFLAVIQAVSDAQGMEISVGTVAAVLTIVGYSLNDTIIVFDRIRENLAKRSRDQSFAEIADRSINETLPRTVLTTGTTLATLMSLYLFGGEVIRGFALVLILGIGLGTFSSIFIAAPVLTMIEERWPRTVKKPARSSTSTTRRETARV